LRATKKKGWQAKAGKLPDILVWIAILAQTRLAMRRNRKRGRCVAMFLAATSLMSCWAGGSRAQEREAQPPGAPKVDSPQRTPPCGDAGDGASPSNSGNWNERAHPKEHRFWDKENDWLFAGVGASRTLDYFSTLNMRRRGRQEILLTNDVVDNHAAFAVIEASATGISIGASYLFHRYGYHKLERWTSIVHIGLATTGAVRNYCLKTAHSTVAGGTPQ
jgi:hypothetical protein